MAYYVREVQSLNHSRSFEIWKTADDEAILLGYRGGPGHYRRAPDETISEAVRRLGPIHELKVAPGHYFPRIARPIIPGPASFTKPRSWQPSLTDNENAIASAKVQLSTLVRQLERICETVHPDQRNLEAYGYDIRNLLILACTEVESHWRAVLKANGVGKDQYTTRDYVSLKNAMRFNDFAISFPDYPWIEAVTPFKNWDERRPTKTLLWYHAYNAVKHDRENEFQRATLRFAFDAVAACIVMIVAQFGEVFGFDPKTSGRPRTFFWICTGPEYELTDHYAEPLETGEWTPVDYPFE